MPETTADAQEEGQKNTYHSGSEIQHECQTDNVGQHAGQHVENLRSSTSAQRVIGRTRFEHRFSIKA